LVTATYDLDATLPTDVQLFYSPDTVAYGWLPAVTFPAKDPGTNTDFWDCNAAGVVYGPFYFKMEAVKKSSCCQPGAINLAMISIEGGTFNLGAAVQPSTDGQGDNGAVTNNHDVTLSDFCMSETQVTQAQFFAVMGEYPSYFQSSTNPNYAPSDNKPVEQVSWYDAITFCNKLSLMEGKTPVYSVSGINWATLLYSDIPITINATWDAATMDLSANGYRLPTEAEWEYAARGGNQSLTAQGNPPDYYYAGSNTANDVAWYRGNNGPSGTPTCGTKPVAQKQHNALGLYDMSGNVYEWCWDWYGAYTATPKTDPTGAVSGTNRVLRGGDQGDFAYNVRVSVRGGCFPSARSFAHMGFRIVCRSSEL
jgi:formylglycine-generating enzyme required for sulfatase activity